MEESVLLREALIGIWIDLVIKLRMGARKMKEVKYDMLIYPQKSLMLMIGFMGKACLHHHPYLLIWSHNLLMLLVEGMMILTEGLVVPDILRNSLQDMKRKSGDGQKKTPWFPRMMKNAEERMTFVRESEKKERGCQ